MGRKITVTPAQETALYNAIVVAEKYARGKKAQQEARDGMRAALMLGLPYKHATDKE